MRWLPTEQLIRADGGTVILSAQAKDALLSTVVNNEGIVEARSVSVRNGVIRLEGGTSGVVSVSGKLDASGTNGGEHGGQIKVTGEKVASVGRGGRRRRRDAQAVARSLVGGDYQGKNPAIQNARRTYVAPTATIRADATDAGDGGKVIVWADGDTRFHGTVSAKGGEQRRRRRVCRSLRQTTARVRRSRRHVRGARRYRHAAARPG